MMPIIRRTYPVLAMGVIVVAMLAAAYGRGYVSGKRERTAYYAALLAEHNEQMANALADAMAKAEEQAARARAAERKHAEAEARLKQRQRTNTRVIREYISKTPGLDQCGLDADGLRHWNAANANTPPGIPAP